MIIRLISDIHLEFEDFNIAPRESDADTILVLAGDIGTGTAIPHAFITEYATQFRHVIYVLGNHEFYHNSVPGVRAFWKTHDIENLTVLDDSEAIIDGVRFLGGTLWTDFNGSNYSSQARAKQCMPDFRCVTNKDGKLMTTGNSVTMHNITKTFIKNKLMDGFDGKTVVVTHHMPHAASIHPKYEGNDLNPAFMSHLDELFEYDMDLWIHGHTHDVVDATVNNTRILCNPVGYPGYERATNYFDELLTVEI